MTGRLVTIEGGEGAGKSTVIAALAARIAAHGFVVHATREPGGTPLGEAVRALVLDPARPEICAESELLLMFASRAQLVRELVRPALARGEWVLSDRFTDASYAYQGGGRGQPDERIADLERWAADGLRADLTLLLDVDVATGRERASGRGGSDRIENEGDGFFERVRLAYRRRAAADPGRFRLVDASGSPDAVRAAACAVIDAYLADLAERA
jgi:dTMP kinase